LSKDAPVIPSPSIRNIPLTLSNNLEASHSASTSPTSSVSPQTPPDAHEPVYKLKNRCTCYSQSIDPNIPLTLSDTSEASHSASTSPVSSVSPQTPPDAHKPVYKLKNRFVDSYIYFPHSLVERRTCYSQSIDPNIPSPSPIPQRPPTRSRPLPRHRFRRKRRPMLTSQYINSSTGSLIPAHLQRQEITLAPENAAQRS
jgi:hypothetical protein